MTEPEDIPVKDINDQEEIKETGINGINIEGVSDNGEELPFFSKEKEVNGEDSHDVGVNGLVKSLKRKKFKKHMEVGRSDTTGGYPSSNERPIKEPKRVEEDPFELDPIIMGLDSNVVKTRGEAPVPISNSFQALLEENEETQIM
ncbi:hypothetical protein Hanom_Chr02g00138571 [Helianthus anomalus]